MKVYYNFVIERNNFYYYETAIQLKGSANDTLKKIEYLLTHFKDLTNIGRERDAGPKLKRFAATIVTQYYERESKIHWLIRILFCFCIARRHRQVAETFARIKALSDPSPPPPIKLPTALPPLAIAQPKPIEVLPPKPPTALPALTIAQPKPIEALPPKPPTALPALTIAQPKPIEVPPPVFREPLLHTEPQPVEEDFEFPFDRSKDTVRHMLGYLDYRDISNFCAGNKQTRALADPLRQKIELPVRDHIRHLKTFSRWERGSKLWDAAKYGKMQRLSGFLLLGTTPNAYCENGDAALHWTAYNGDVAGTAILLKHKAHADAPGHKGQTPFVQAYNRYEDRPADYLDIMKHLLEKGANPNQKWPNVNQPLLHKAIGDRRVEVVKLLLSAKADPKLTNAQGDAALHMAVLSGDVALTRLLVEARAPIDQPTADDKGYPPLFTAYYFLRDPIQKDMMRFLLESKANPNALNRRLVGLTPDMAYKAERDFLELLIDHKADINREVLGFTTLGWACGAGNRYEMPHVPSVLLVNFLLERGAEPRIRMKDGRLAVEVAQDNGLNQIAAVLWKRMPRLHRAIYQADRDYKADIGPEGALERALAPVRALLDKNAKVNRPYGPGNAGETPLFYAYRVCTGPLRRPMMQLLLERGANRNERDHDGEALVDHMAWKGERDLLELMINQGAEINQLGNGCTPLGWACSKNQPNIEIIRFLLDRGADPYIADQARNLPLAYVQNNGPIAVLLYQHMNLFG